MAVGRRIEKSANSVRLTAQKIIPLPERAAQRDLAQANAALQIITRN
jgi:hypothetical protein